MIPRLSQDEDTPENDVRYGIADCRKRLSRQRATLRAQHQIPIDVSNGESELSARDVLSYGESLATVAIGRSSISRSVECLLEPAASGKLLLEESAGREEAVIT